MKWTQKSVMQMVLSVSLKGQSNAGVVLPHTDGSWLTSPNASSSFQALALNGARISRADCEEELRRIEGNK